jgi:hypothetical protein
MFGEPVEYTAAYPRILGAESRNYQDIIKEFSKHCKYASANLDPSHTGGEARY